MARKSTAEQAELSEARPEPMKRVKITHYKVLTSIGRLVEGQREVLPAWDADRLIAAGHAVACE